MIFSSKPEFKSGLFHCPTCGSTDTVALDSPSIDPQEPYDTVIWCCCGIVSVLGSDKPSEVVYNFSDN